MIVRNLSGIYTGEGFKTKRGRNIEKGDDGLIKGPVDIRCQGQQISEIGHNLVAETEEMIIDGSDKIATAAFVDSHTHGLFSGNRSFEYFIRWAGRTYTEIANEGGGIKTTFNDFMHASEDALISELSQKILEMQAHGTCSVEIKSGYGKNSLQELRMLKIIKKVKELHPSMSFRSTFLGLHAIPQDANEALFTQEMISLLPQVKQLGLADFVDAFPEEGFFSLENSLRFCEAAKELGLKAKVHADEITEVKATESFVKLGAQSVDHLQKITEQGIKALSDSSCVGTLLPATSFYLGLEYTHARKLLESGVQVALATDFNPGSAPEKRMGLTLLLAASQMKMRPEEILCAATFNGAAALNWSHKKGLILEGYDADILLWPNEGRSPLEALILANQKPMQVISRGQVIDTTKA